MSMKAYWVINVNKPRQLRRQLSRSFVRRFLELLSGLATYPTGGVSPFAFAPERILDTSNTLRLFAVTFGALAPQGSTDGIQVGNGTTPVLWNNFKLASPIQHSNTGLSYGAMSHTNIVNEPNGGSFRLIRSFTNNSSSNITITEVGLTARVVTEGSVYVQVLLARDLLTTPIVVSPGATMTVRYIIRVIM